MYWRERWKRGFLYKPPGAADPGASLDSESSVARTSEAESWNGRGWLTLGVTNKTQQKLWGRLKLWAVPVSGYSVSKVP